MCGVLTHSSGSEGDRNCTGIAIHSSCNSHAWVSQSLRPIFTNGETQVQKDMCMQASEQELQATTKHMKKSVWLDL